MIHALFAGDLTADPVRRKRATELMEQATQYGLVAMDATAKFLVRVGAVDTAPREESWRLYEGSRRLAHWKSAHPDVIVGFDALHAALATLAFPGVPCVVHVDTLEAGLPGVTLETLAQVHGLPALIGQVLRTARHVLLTNPRHASVMVRTFGVPSERLHPCTLSIDDVAHWYIEAAQLAATHTAPSLRRADSAPRCA